MSLPSVSIVIPAWNEAQRIGATLERILQFSQQSPYAIDILVVDDGSTDSTSAVAGKYEGVSVLTLPENRGKGAAVRAGMKASKGDIVLFSDADLSTPIEEFDNIIPAIAQGEVDVSIGSRALDRSKVQVHQPWYRELMGRCFNVIVQVLVFRGITDTQCGFKAFSRKAVHAVVDDATIDGFSFDVELLFLAKRAGMRIQQTPVVWINDDRSTVNPITDSLRMIVELFKIRFARR